MKPWKLLVAVLGFAVVGACGSPVPPQPERPVATQTTVQTGQHAYGLLDIYEDQPLYGWFLENARE